MDEEDQVTNSVQMMLRSSTLAPINELLVDISLKKNSKFRYEMLNNICKAIILLNFNIEKSRHCEKIESCILSNDIISTIANIINGENPNKTVKLDSEKERPLIEIAMMLGNVEMVKTLLNLGAKFPSNSAITDGYTFNNGDKDKIISKLQSKNTLSYEYFKEVIDSKNDLFGQYIFENFHITIPFQGLLEYIVHGKTPQKRYTYVKDIVSRYKTDSSFNEQNILKQINLGNFKDIKLLNPHKKSNSFDKILYKIQDGKTNEVVYLLNNYASPLAIHAYYKTSFLHAACIYKNYEIDIYEEDQLQNTPLAISISANDTKTAKLLIKHSTANYSNRKPSKDVLEIACQSGNLEIVKLLLSKSYIGITEPLALQNACLNGNEEIVRTLIKSGLSLKSSGQTSLLYAVDQGNTSILKILLENGVSLLSWTGELAVSSAAIKGHLDIVRILLENGAKIRKGSDIMRKVSATGNLEMMEFLYEHGAEINGYDKRNGSNALSEACARGDFEIVKFLVENGINLQEFGTKSISEASEGGFNKIISFLFNAGVKLNPKDRYYGKAIVSAINKGYIDVMKTLIDNDINVNIFSWNGDLPIIVATKSENINALRILLENGADPNIIDKESSQSALTIAIQKDNYNMVKLLIDHGASVENGQNFILACKVGNFDIIKLIFQKGVCMANCGLEAIRESCANNKTVSLKFILDNYKDFPMFFSSKSKNPILDCCVKDNADALKLLLDYGVDFHVCENEAIHRSILNRSIHTLELLLKRGACSTQELYKDTPLALAIKKKYLDIAETLLKYSADPNCSVGTYGYYESECVYLIIYESKCGNYDSVKLLLEYGANPNLVGKNHRTALSEACATRNIPIIRELISHGANIMYNHGSIIKNEINSGDYDIIKILLEFTMEYKIPIESSVLFSLFSKNLHPNLKRQLFSMGISFGSFSPNSWRDPSLRIPDVIMVISGSRFKYII